MDIFGSLHSAQMTEHLSRTLETFVTSSGAAKEGPTRENNYQAKKEKVLSAHTAILIDFFRPSAFAGQGFKRTLSGCSVLRREEPGMYLLVSIRWQTCIATLLALKIKALSLPIPTLVSKDPRGG